LLLKPYRSNLQWGIYSDNPTSLTGNLVNGVGLKSLNKNSQTEPVYSHSKKVKND